MMRKFKYALLAMCACLAFAGCNHDTGEADDTVAVEKVEITSTVTQVFVGKTITLTASVSPDDAADKSVKWSTSDAAIATVNENGVVTGVKDGKVTITAKAGEKSACVDITVNPEVDHVLSSFTIPAAGDIKAGSKVTATATGENFMAPGVAVSDFSVSCEVNPAIVKDSEITIIDDKTITVTLTIPEVPSSSKYSISTVKFSWEAKYRTFGFSIYNTKNINVGDVILKDGKYVDGTRLEDVTFNETDTVPVAVVAGFTDTGLVIGMGLKRGTGTSLCWQTGSYYSFDDIAPIWTGTIGNYTIPNDKGGLYNWKYICSCDTGASTTNLSNYPIFEFAQNYGTTTLGLESTSRIKSDWYVPSIKELYELIYKNKSVISASVKAAYQGTDAVDFGLNYWSSSVDYVTSRVNRLSFNFYDNKGIQQVSRDKALPVLVLRVFTF